MSQLVHQPLHEAAAAATPVASSSTDLRKQGLGFDVCQIYLVEQPDPEAVLALTFVLLCLGLEFLETAVLMPGSQGDSRLLGVSRKAFLRP